MKKYLLFIIALLGVSLQAQDLPDYKVMSDAHCFRVMSYGESYEQTQLYATYFLLSQGFEYVRLGSNKKMGTMVEFMFQPFIDEGGRGLFLKLEGNAYSDSEIDLLSTVERYQKMLVNDTLLKDIQSMIEPVAFMDLGEEKQEQSVIRYEKDKDGFRVSCAETQLKMGDQPLRVTVDCSFSGDLKWDALKFSDDSTCTVNGITYHVITAEVSKIAVQKLLMSIIRRVNQKYYVCDEDWLLNEVRKAIPN